MKLNRCFPLFVGQLESYVFVIRNFFADDEITEEQKCLIIDCVRTIRMKADAIEKLLTEGQNNG